MILDRLSHRNCYESIPGLKDILDALAEIDEAHMPTERVVIDGDHAFINPVSLTTKPVEECRYEAHRIYADVHCIVSGTEEIIVRDISRLTEMEPFSAEKDIGFYEGDPGTVCILKPGDFLVCFPQDAHKVAIAPAGPSKVIKLVAKLKVG